VRRENGESARKERSRERTPKRKLRTRGIVSQKSRKGGQAQRAGTEGDEEGYPNQGKSEKEGKLVTRRIYALARSAGFQWAEGRKGCLRAARERGIKKETIKQLHGNGSQGRRSQ